MQTLRSVCPKCGTVTVEKTSKTENQTSALCYGCSWGIDGWIKQLKKKE